MGGNVSVIGSDTPATSREIIPDPTVIDDEQHDNNTTTPIGSVIGSDTPETSREIIPDPTVTGDEQHDNNTTTPTATSTPSNLNVGGQAVADTGGLWQKFKAAAQKFKDTAKLYAFLAGQKCALIGLCWGLYSVFEWIFGSPFNDSGIKGFYTKGGNAYVDCNLRDPKFHDCKDALAAVGPYGACRPSAMVRYKGGGSDRPGHPGEGGAIAYCEMRS